MVDLLFLSLVLAIKHEIACNKMCLGVCENAEIKSEKIASTENGLGGGGEFVNERMDRCRNGNNVRP